MGRPAARLETMLLMISSFVLVCIVGKRQQLSLYGCYFLICVIRRPCSLDILLTMNQTLCNVWFHVRTQIIVGILPRYLISYNKYCRTYGYEKCPSDTVVPIGSSHIHCFNPINLYLSIRYNGIINNIRFSPPIVQNIPFRTVTSPNKTEDVISRYNQWKFQ